ncbi:hypothetical protein VTN49DRAFT_4865 [Thermomyces lanuginosus]|uniref:uncharacterized protein n=1 Tax=Thermomyces lanuginosus TaxID=5541 RepID=UPI00374269B8
MRSATIVLAALLGSPVAASLYGQSSLNHSCVLDDPVWSCSKRATPEKVDSCCSETFGGLLLATQFWNTHTGLEDQGQLLPKNSWTLHGLWPDFCNGSYTQYCDLSRQYDPDPSPNTTTGTPDGTPVPPYKGPSIDKLIEPFGAHDLLDWMNKYWVNLNAPNHDLWAHEFSKHATCFSTFDLPCYGPKRVEHEDILDYFTTVIAYFRRHPTYDWLARAGIRPSNSTRYSLKHIQHALRRQSGATPYLGCSGPRFNETEAGKGSKDNGFTVLTEVWYYMHVLGRPQDLHSRPVDPSGSMTNCATSKNAILYPERSRGSEKVFKD